MNLNLWSSRALTIYGRAEIVRSLAISKMLYVFNVIDPPQSTLKYLKTLLSKFIWRGKKPKIKHTTIIGDYDVGGIKFTDLEIRLSVQRIIWIKRLQTSPDSLISRLLNNSLKNIGGLSHVRANFDINRKIKYLKIPTFYVTCLKEWSNMYQSILLL